MNSFISKIFKSSLISSVCLSILGLLLIFESETVIVSISYIIGAILIAMGVLGAMRYFYAEIKSIIDIVYGFVTVILGIVVILHPNAIATLIPYIMGVLIIVSSVTKMQYAITLNRYKNKMWKSSLIISIITLLFGLLLVFNPFAATKFVLKIVGWIILVYGVLDLISTIRMRNTFKELSTMIEEKNKSSEVTEAKILEIKDNKKKEGKNGE